MSFRQLYEHKIARLLAELEASTGTIVKEIGIVSIDVTTLDSKVKQLSRRVVLELEPIPGSHWDTGGES